MKISVVGLVFLSITLSQHLQWFVFVKNILNKTWNHLHAMYCNQKMLSANFHKFTSNKLMAMLIFNQFIQRTSPNGGFIKRIIVSVNIIWFYFNSISQRSDFEQLSFGKLHVNHRKYLTNSASFCPFKEIDPKLDFIHS